MRNRYTQEREAKILPEAKQKNLNMNMRSSIYATDQGEKHDHCGNDA